VPTLEQIGQRYSNVVLRIICDSFIDLFSLPVEKCLWTTEKEAMDLASCDIGLAPLPDDPFTKGKCGYKILQYCACGLPVVASSVGVNTQLIEEGKCGFLADNPDQWLARLSQLIDNADLRRAMGTAGCDYVANYDLEIVGRKLVDIVANWLSEPERNTK
jgi:glycosyltransferase involved in cell wall biosynthesis